MTRANGTSRYRLKAALVAGFVAIGLGLSLPAASMSAPTGGGDVRSLTPAQKKAKARAMAKCKKIKSKAKRNACVKKVNKKYAPKKPAAGKTWQVGVFDNYYLPADLEIKVNDSINWTWQEPMGREAHDVRMQSGPPGVGPFDIRSPTTAVFGSKFKRQFKVAGTYDLFCSLHTLMNMQVKVTK